MCQESSYRYGPGLTLRSLEETEEIWPQGNLRPPPTAPPAPPPVHQWPCSLGIPCFHLLITYQNLLNISHYVKLGSLSKAEREYCLKNMERKIANSWPQSRHSLKKIKVKLSSLGQLLVKLVSFKKIGVGASLVVPSLRLHFPMPGVQVQSLVGDMPGDQKAKI